MSPSKSSYVLKEGYKWCPHCDGYTVCDCGTCGVQVPRTWRSTQEVRFEKGICKVCNGIGQIPR